MTKMRAVTVDDANKKQASSLSITEVDAPKITDKNHVLVNVKAFGLNRMDVMQRQGLASLHCTAGRRSVMIH